MEDDAFFATKLLSSLSSPLLLFFFFLFFHIPGDGNTRSSGVLTG